MSDFSAEAFADRLAENTAKINKTLAQSPELYALYRERNKLLGLPVINENPRRTDWNPLIIIKSCCYV